MSRNIGIAAAQMASVPHNAKATLDKIDSLVEQSNWYLPWVDMFCFPELILDGLSHLYLEGKCPKGNPFQDRSQTIYAILRHAFKWMVSGSMSERDGNDVYNTAIAISPFGEIVAHYRKIFP